MNIQEHIDRLVAARLQADIMGAETIIVARTDGEAANLLGASTLHFQSKKFQDFHSRFQDPWTQSKRGNLPRDSCVLCCDVCRHQHRPP